MHQLVGFAAKPQWVPAMSEALAATNDQPAKRRAFSYTEMMNSGQQQLSTDQIAALEQEENKRPDEPANPPTTKP